MEQSITDQEVNSYNAEIRPEIDTPEKRLEVVRKVIDQNLKLISEVKFAHLSEFDNRNKDEKPTAFSPCIYWVYTFKTPSIEHSCRLHTATLANYGGVEFNLHSINIKNHQL